MRTIDADSLYEIVKSLDIMVGGKNIFPEEAKRSILNEIDMAPTLDAVKVIHCANCKHSAVDVVTSRRMCIRMGEVRPNGAVWGGTAVRDEHFCSHGEY